MALAECNHHAAPRGQKTARAGAWVRVVLHGEVPEQPTPRSPARSTTGSTSTACRSSSRTWTFQFLALVVIMEVFKVFSKNKVRCSALSSRSSTFLLVEVFKIFSLILVRQLHPQFRVMSWVIGFFALFPFEKKRGDRREFEFEGARALELIHAGG